MLPAFALPAASPPLALPTALRLRSVRVSFAPCGVVARDGEREELLDVVAALPHVWRGLAAKLTPSLLPPCLFSFSSSHRLGRRRCHWRSRHRRPRSPTHLVVDRQQAKGVFRPPIQHNNAPICSLSLPSWSQPPADPCPCIFPQAQPPKKQKQSLPRVGAGVVPRELAPSFFYDPYPLSPLSIPLVLGAKITFNK